MKHGILLGLLLLSLSAWAQQEPLKFSSPEQEARFEHLTKQLRCLVCQNQDLADSEAELAGDLRKEILEMMQAGKTDDEIKKYLVDRYGDFVLYKPPVQGNTYLLWLLPGVLLLLGALVLRSQIKQRAALLKKNENPDAS